MAEQTYRMSYLFKPGPPKPKDQLAKDEGLADTLLVVSILGTVGGPGGLSTQVHQVGPDGLEPVSPALAYNVATVLLNYIDQAQVALGAPPEGGRLKKAAGEALAALRRPFQRRR